MIYNIHFADFWSSFHKKNNFFTNILKNDLDITTDYDKPADILIFCMFGNENKNKKYDNCFKIFYSGESFKFSKYWNEIHNADIYLTMYSDLSKFTEMDLSNKLQIQFTLYDMYNIIYNKYDLKKASTILNKSNNTINNKNNFCLFMVNNIKSGEGAELRVKLFNKLNKYKMVHSAGGSLNNGFIVPRGFENKIKFLENYKFCISFENIKEDDYISEKIWEPLISGAIPIYYGANNVNKFFNKNNFINYNDFNDIDKLVNFIIDIDNDDEKYNNYFKNSPMIYEKNYNNIINTIVNKIKQIYK